MSNATRRKLAAFNFFCRGNNLASFWGLLTNRDRHKPFAARSCCSKSTRPHLTNRFPCASPRARPPNSNPISASRLRTTPYSPEKKVSTPPLGFDPAAEHELQAGVAWAYAAEESPNRLFSPRHKTIFGAEAPGFFLGTWFLPGRKVFFFWPLRNKFFLAMSVGGLRPLPHRTNERALRGTHARKKSAGHSVLSSGKSLLFTSGNFFRPGADTGPVPPQDTQKLRSSGWTPQPAKFFFLSAFGFSNPPGLRTKTFPLADSGRPGGPAKTRNRRGAWQHVLADGRKFPSFPGRQKNPGALDSFSLIVLAGTKYPRQF